MKSENVKMQVQWQQDVCRGATVALYSSDKTRMVASGQTEPGQATVALVFQTQ